MCSPHLDSSSEVASPKPLDAPRINAQSFSPNPLFMAFHLNIIEQEGSTNGPGKLPDSICNRGSNSRSFCCKKYDGEYDQDRPGNLSGGETFLQEQIRE